MNAPDGSTLVSHDTRARVRKAVQELGYRPSWRAQVLAKRRSHAIAIAYSSPTGAVPRGIYWEIVDALEQFLAARDYFPTFLHLREADERVERMLGDGRFDGCISLGLIAPAVLEMMRRHRVPAVLINSDADDGWSRVDVDDSGGGQQLMAHLLGLGHRRILYYAGPAVLAHPSARNRYNAYRDAMAEAGLPAEPAFVGPPERVVAELKTRGAAAPTAIVDFEHFSAIRLLQALWRGGLRVPADVSVATFNDTDPVADVIPPLTTVALPGRTMAERAVEMLLRRIESRDDPPGSLVLDETLVVRESTAPPTR